ncbi:hypothetical protein M427DRAFT_506635 [Gonapodya prolifera JEL478]|uniref:Uncharacterized protein n=1 Tax=Gonapodya prolifera (strain JEL478) TaxID=1344416 RepID=A0A139AT01_GONPJ|nr:hypothetical protein M427DRAFT_506635 [Gonapodya prolifera JEL478]|eukprot:KXS19625.1 hypothetical protein M427DRAFT_506635 [Gonapodya prolifera JEL478]
MSIEAAMANDCGSGGVSSIMGGIEALWALQCDSRCCTHHSTRNRRRGFHGSDDFIRNTFCGGSMLAPSSPCSPTRIFKLLDEHFRLSITLFVTLLNFTLRSAESLPYPLPRPTCGGNDRSAAARKGAGWNPFQLSDKKPDRNRDSRCLLVVTRP